MSQKTELIKERFLSKIIVAKNGCWEWTGALNNNGYGEFMVKTNRLRLAHRISFWLFKGNLREWLVLDHLCRNKKCVNPDHLEEVTQKENVHRGKNFNLNKTHCKRGHLFDEKNTRINKQRERICRQCQNLAQKAWQKDNLI